MESNTQHNNTSNEVNIDDEETQQQSSSDDEAETVEYEDQITRFAEIKTLLEELLVVRDGELDEIYNEQFNKIINACINGDWDIHRACRSLIGITSLAYDNEAAIHFIADIFERFIFGYRDIGNVSMQLAYILGRADDQREFETNLFQVIKNDDIDQFKTFCGERRLIANMKIPDEIGDTACEYYLLTWAIYFGSKKCANTLIENGANKELALVEAIVEGISGRRVKCMDILFYHKLDVNFITEREHSLFTLFVLMKPYDLKNMRKLLEYGANANYRYPNGRTALMNNVRCNYNNVRKINLLLEYGVDINCQDNEGNTALILHASAGYARCVRRLIIYGADINIQNNQGKTALICATENDYGEIVSLLNGGNFDDVYGRDDNDSEFADGNDEPADDNYDE